MHFITTPNLQAPDDFYEALIDCHRDLAEEQSHALNARLVLLLANHIGNQAVLSQALQAARDSAPRSALTPCPQGHPRMIPIRMNRRRAGTARAGTGPGRQAGHPIGLKEMP